MGEVTTQGDHATESMNQARLPRQVYDPNTEPDRPCLLARTLYRFSPRKRMEVARSCTFCTPARSDESRPELVLPLVLHSSNPRLPNGRNPSLTGLGKSSMCHFRTPWDFINPLAMECRTTNGISMLISIHPCCARRRFANSWLDSNCWARRNATSLQKSRHSGCAKSCRPDRIDQSMRDVRVCVPYTES
jgi:hypothetical protein